MEGPPELPGVEHRWVETSRIRMHVAEAGSGDPLVLLHGWPQHWYAWRRVIPELSRHYRVLCPDLRGLGWSDAPSSGYEKEELAADVLALLDALEIERVRLIGHDWGGTAGFLMCLHSPERVERYVMLNAAHPWLRVGPREVIASWRLWYQAALSLPWLGSWVLQRGSGLVDLLFRLWSAGDVWSEEERRIFTERLQIPERARASALYYRTFLLRELPGLAFGRYRSQRLRTPTLVLFGTEDGVLRAHHLRGFEGHVDDGRIELVPGVGHFIAEEAPETVVARALKFFGTEPAQS
jgi:pimeloyl-ACP methyl ester carboxylesterase